MESGWDTAERMLEPVMHPSREPDRKDPSGWLSGASAGALYLVGAGTELMQMENKCPAAGYAKAASAE